MKKLLYLIFISALFSLIACGGDNGSSSEKTGLLTMGVSKGTISADLSDPLSSASDETVDVTFDYSAYNQNLKALPVVINGYHISYERQDCSSCPAIPSRTVASGISIKAGETKSETITVLTGTDKLSLPVSALRSDIYNPVLNQHPVVHDDHTAKIAAGASVLIGQIGENVPKTYSFGYYDGTKTSFSAYLEPPVEQGSVVVKINDEQVASDTSNQQIVGSKSGVVQDEQIGTGSGSQTDFYARVYGGISPGTLVVRVASGQVAVDNGSGSIIGSEVSGTVDYGSGWISLSFTTAPASGAVISVDYIYNISITGLINYTTGYLVLNLSGRLHSGDILTVDYRIDNTTGTVSGNTIAFPMAMFSSDSSLSIVKGTVIITFDGAVIGKDDGQGSIVSSSGVSGTVDYDDKTVQISITPVPQSGTITAYASLCNATGIYLTPVPVRQSSVNLEWGDLVCSEKSGTFQYPCSGTVNHSTGAIGDLVINSASSENNGHEDVVAAFQVNSGNVTGGEVIGTGEGTTSDYIFNLGYPPIAPPESEYSLTIITTGGLMVNDSGGGLLKGDVCSGKLSTVDYKTGQVSICFSRALNLNENVLAYYRTSGMRLKAVVEAKGYEVGGEDIKLKKEITIQLN
ncbi:MAG: hypothetical protein IBX72_11275 [Nitrospirae bacterium]|nr:hypothetical protein [Nitrospirota bacterium]